MPATRPVDEVVAELREAVEHLASFPRPSASDGERRAADWIAARLRREGCDAHVEEERAHGELLVAARAAHAPRPGPRRCPAGARPRSARGRPRAAAGIADDITGGAQWFRRRLLPSRSTWNVVAEAGDRDADRTLVVVAHHDAAHTSVLFHPAPSRWVGRRFPELLERTDTTPPLMWPVVGGPLLDRAGRG